jgi:hypothetical protein
MAFAHGQNDPMRKFGLPRSMLLEVGHPKNLFTCLAELTYCSSVCCLNLPRSCVLLRIQLYKPSTQQPLNRVVLLEQSSVSAVNLFPVSRLTVHNSWRIWVR